jgi:Tat protein secretion system quality control protein TatD with DNase activity
LLNSSETSSPGDKNKEQDLESAITQLIPTFPTPTPLSQLLITLRSNLLSHPSALLGEVGLDRASRIPQSYPATPLVLTPFTIPLPHQLAILEAQLDLAVELRRAVSMHSVKAQMATKDLMERMKQRWGDEKWEMISVDLHSCGLSSQTWRDMEKKHQNVFLSLSTAINSRSPNHRALIAACSPSRILVESDYHDISQCVQRTWEMVLTVAEVKGWRVEERWDYDEKSGVEGWGVVRWLEENWKTFKKGGHWSPDTIKKTRPRKQQVLKPDSDAMEP